MQLRQASMMLVLWLAASGLHAAESEAVDVEVRPLAQLSEAPLRRASAEVLPAQRSVLAAETSARIASIAVEVGERVEAGAQLLRLDARDAELRVAAARAAVRAAESAAELSAVRLEKARKLIERSYVSADEVKEREAIHAGELATVALRQSDLDLARRELERCLLKAPFEGWVVERSAQIGQWVSPGTPLLTLVQADKVEISARLDGPAAAELKPASAVEFIDESDRRWPLRWLRSAPVLDPATRQAEVRFDFLNEAAAAGSSGRIEWRAAQDELPAELLVRRDGRLGVFVHEAGKARFVALPQAIAGRPVAVDLPAESQIITAGRDLLRDGDAVRVVAAGRVTP
jgi:RND family efflux transporter MFP subunit